ncbi:Transposase IS66 family protein [Jannaschia seohaensis]|uniref:Transposase IS66 family protein n=1 Tax=Jannaschia seohaensis TaxID=475081 RepID=A0A2Y9BY53_9RHOB|nr:transposase IS66 family protein [Jannaschia seohaensis]SSA42022.1 Transposase IS66 family protein [Jannaschia seohaensis]
MAKTRLPRLRPFPSDGSIEIDNSRAECAMRACVLGGKDALFAGSQSG